MPRHPEFWRLPGARRFVQRLLSHGRSRSVFVHDPIDPGLLAATIEGAVREEGLDTCLRIDGSDGRNLTLVDRLTATCGRRATTIDGFALNLGYTVLVADGFAPSDPLGTEVGEFARAAATRSDDAAPRVIAVGAAMDSGWSEPTWRAATTEGVLNHLDSASFAAQGAKAYDTMPARLAVSVAIEVGAWDLEIVERIQSLPELCAVRPDLHVDRWADERSGGWAGGAAAAWTRGSCDVWAGGPCVHPIFLAVNSPNLLARRVWRGHVAVLFPWLEEIRQAVVHRYASRLVADPASFYDDVESLDWGPICSQMASEPPGVLRFLHGCRKLRNCLAHGRPADWQDIANCMRSFERWAA